MLHGCRAHGSSVRLTPSACVDTVIANWGVWLGETYVAAVLSKLLLPLLQVETEGDVATAFTLARILSNIPPSRGGPTSIVIFDIHALQVRLC